MPTPTFPLSQAAYTFRALKYDPDRTPLRGWDVFALQTGLGAVGFGVDNDGFLGPFTSAAIHALQASRGLVNDGIAGTVTQREIAVVIERRASADLAVPERLLYGQLEHESSFWLGNQSALRPDHSADCGVAQRNSALTPPEQGFTAGDSIRALARQVADAHRRYAAELADDDRAWRLAAGSWNAPAFTDALAAGKTSVKVGGSTIDLSPGAPARVKIETYIAEVSAYFNP